MAADDDGLTGVWFVGQKYFARSLAPDSVAREIPLFAQVKQWLALYFAGQEPELEIPIHMVGTAFQKAVWRILRTIPYGQTMTYGAIARQVAEELGIRRMSPQAVGGAVGHNPISIRAGPESQIVDLGKSGGGFPLPAQKRNRPVK